MELKVSLGWGAYYNADEMGDMRPTWHGDASLAQSHRGEEGRRVRVLRMGAPKREVPFEYPRRELHQIAMDKKFTEICCDRCIDV